MALRKDCPSSVVFVDVETTGLTASDRIVSVGAVWLSTNSVGDGAPPVSYVHLVFNPDKRSHPQAAAVHGYSDIFLSKQDSFTTYAEYLRSYLEQADQIVAHNVAFDLPFLNREFASAGLRALTRPSFCTLEACRTNRSGSASLRNVCSQLGLTARVNQHDALEDAWLCMMIYLSLHGHQHLAPYPYSTLCDPFNVRNAELNIPPKKEDVSIGGSSNTGLSAAGTAAEAQRITDLVESVKLAKREARLVDAEKILIEELDKQEKQSRESGFGVAPWYYEQLAIVYAKQGRDDEEIEVLLRYDRQIKAPGATPAQLKLRLEKALERQRKR
jgi:DNA polymerase-3 subunit epsilon